MRVFVTGATGWIGMAVVRELIAHGHQVLGLCRSPDKAAALAATGAEVVTGAIADLDGLRAAAARADGVIHLAFNHDFSRYIQNCEDDRGVIAALGKGLAGSDRPLVVTSATPIANTIAGEPSREGNPTLWSGIHPRAASEEAAWAVSAGGGNVSAVRLPQVHDTAMQGLITPLIAMWRAAGACSVIGEGANRWPAAFIVDVAPLYRLALEAAVPGARWHAVGEEGVPLHAIAETVAGRLGLPVRSIGRQEAEAAFGWLARFVAHDMPASGAATQATLGWVPRGPGLLTDLANLEAAGAQAAGHSSDDRR